MTLPTDDRDIHFSALTASHFNCANLRGMFIVIETLKAPPNSLSISDRLADGRLGVSVA